MNILSIKSSPNPVSVTNALSDELILQIKAKNNISLIERDLTKNPIPHLSGLAIHAAYTNPSERTPEMNDALKLGTELIDEIIKSDVIIIAAPMWNFSIPSVLKAWIDQIVRVGVTFTYENGIPKGLITSGKKLIITSSRGGVYSSGPYQAFDYQETLVKGVFNFLGITNVEIITSEGVRDKDPRQEALKNCKSKIEEIVLNLK